MMRRGVCAAVGLVALLVSSEAAGGERHAVYAEAFGKGGLWGVGYDYQIQDRLSFGGVVSYFPVEGMHTISLSPYLGARILGAGRHRWFAHLGPQLVFVHTRSTVPELQPGTSVGIAGELSTGYEYRHRVLVRVFAMAIAGRGGFAPWAGVSLGWAR